MKIIDVECILMTLPSKYIWGTRPHNFSFVRVKTDTEIDGLGETLLGYYVPELVPPLVAHFRDVVIGQDPREIQRLWEQMYVKALRWGHVGPAISVMGAIEIACWDILGKTLQVPVYQLLGGCVHDKMRCYASTGSPAWPMEKTLKRFEELMGQGFTALKTVHGFVGREEPVSVASLVKQETEKFTSLREAFGGDVDLMLDPAAPFNREPWSGDVALRVVQALDAFHLLWVEQPVRVDKVDDYLRIRRHCTTPLAAGENATTLNDLKPFLETRALDVVQPDSIWGGGIGESLKMVAAAEAHDMRTAPHCFSGVVGLCANYHVAFASRSCFIVEFPVHQSPVIDRTLMESGFTFKDGYLFPAGGPGLGAELPDALIEKYPFVPGTGLSHARSPFPRPVPPDWQPHSDGRLSW
jgi:L-alanine-DL-glutamate epimerase-like enolase superfamily enzyme